ncbi:hypothetical protein KP509_18G061000 [Ceratopteris richardii]|uniref:CBS domain-containing protein n=1 Tax=Ceratopteris richardii TaxID=49495 RepID=A0A8T2SS17_CERRI|nr:hypothetical protein KP509_18G061000 [Ceratopteris richardii]
MQFNFFTLECTLSASFEVPKLAETTLQRLASPIVSAHAMETTFSCTALSPPLLPSFCPPSFCPPSQHRHLKLHSSQKLLRFAIAATQGKQDYYTVGNFMTPKDDLIVAKTTTSVDEALEMLVYNRITGLPVVDDDGKLIGVVSDFDLLALDSISGRGFTLDLMGCAIKEFSKSERPSSSSLFPEPGSTWKAFKEIQKLISKTHGKTVGEVMTPSPLVVQENSNLEVAARLLLGTQKRRLPVVDDAGKLVGLLTRGNMIKAALQAKKDSGEESESE